MYALAESLRTNHGQQTSAIPVPRPARIRMNRPSQPANSGQRMNSGATNSSWPLNMQPTPSTSPAVSHQSSDTSSAASRNHGGNQTSHCGQPIESSTDAGLSQTSVAATAPHTGPRKGL